MENFDAAAVYVATIYLSTGEDATALVAFSEDTITAYNENDQKHKVKTFSQVSGTDRNRFFVGGYLPSDGGSASGSYTSEATVQVLFQ